jgi:AraC-like DNA-binding protein
MTARPEPSAETRAYLARVLSLDALLPTPAESEQITRKLETRLERQKAGRASLASQRADPVSQMFSYGRKPERRKAERKPRAKAAPKPKAPPRVKPKSARIARLAELMVQAVAAYRKDTTVSMTDLATRFGLSRNTLARRLAAEGLRSLDPADPMERRQAQAVREVSGRPPGCLTVAEIIERSGLKHAQVGRRIRAAGIKSKTRTGLLAWYDEAELTAGGVFRVGRKNGRAS